ncbi:MAG: nucleobase:cation symporter-2 family protein [bacterium]|nr:nucleobase:cation symporter-2 family protein [bacterium]
MPGRDEFLDIDFRPPFRRGILVAFQHMLAMFVGIITPPLIIARALGLGVAETGFFVSMALFASGATTYIQARRFGPLGSGLLCVMGTSFAFVPVCLQAGAMGGLPLILGMGIAVAPVEAALSRVLRRARRVFPPIVTGTVVTLIGLSLIRVGMTDLAGGFGSPDFGSPRNLAIGFSVMLAIIMLSRFGRGLVQVGAILLGLAAGYAFCALLGMVDFSHVAEAGWISVPVPLRYGLRLDARLLIPFAIAYVVTTVESIGDITAVCAVSRLPVTGDSYWSRLRGGILSDGIGSALAGLFNSLPNTTFSQNIGVIQLTGVACRSVGLMVAAILALLGVLPKLAAIVSVMPAPVLGGATITMFGLVAAAGIRIAVGAGLAGRNLIIFASSTAVGLGVEFVPEALGGLPELARTALGSGLNMGAVFALALNLILPED